MTNTKAPPLIQAIIDELPPSGHYFPVARRAAALSLFDMAMDFVYPEDFEDAEEFVPQPFAEADPELTEAVWGQLPAAVWTLAQAKRMFEANEERKNRGVIQVGENVDPIDQLVGTDKMVIEDEFEDPEPETVQPVELKGQGHYRDKYVRERLLSLPNKGPWKDGLDYELLELLVSGTTVANASLIFEIDKSEVQKRYDLLCPDKEDNAQAQVLHVLKTMAG